jgi:hypothetical protein
MGDDYYIADKSIENINFIPFNTIHRGNLVYQVSRISPSHNGGSRLVMECLMDHGGLLNRDYANQLTTKYLVGIQKMDGYFSKEEFVLKLKTFFNANWRIH